MFISCYYETIGLIEGGECIKTLFEVNHPLLIFLRDYKAKIAEYSIIKSTTSDKRDIHQMIYEASKK